MSELLGTYWWLILVALLIGIIVAWWVFAGRRTRVETARKPDVLDEGVAPAQRNQALIDAPSAAAAATTAPIAPQAPPPVATPSPSPPAATAPEPAVEPAPAPIPTASGAADDLTQIKGLGPKLKTMLEALGITRFDQIASWSEADIDRIDAQLGTFQGRIRRDSWVEQAKFLAAGDMAGFAGKFGNA